MYCDGDNAVLYFESGYGIIKTKAEQMGIEINESLVHYIAENIKVNTRQIEGVVTWMYSLSSSGDAIACLFSDVLLIINSILNKLIIFA